MEHKTIKKEAKGGEEERYISYIDHTFTLLFIVIMLVEKSLHYSDP